MDKLKIKYLTQKQKDRICKFWKNHCYQCPLNFQLFRRHYCYKEIELLNKTIEEFWNTELNEKQTNVANDTFYIEDKEIKIMKLCTNCKHEGTDINEWPCSMCDDNGYGPSKWEAKNDDDDDKKEDIDRR